MAFLNIISFGGAAIGLALSFQLAGKKRGHAAKLLALYLFCIAVSLLEPVSGSGIFKSILSVALACISFTMGPALYLYTRLRLDHQTWRTTHGIHFLPAITVLLLMLFALPLEPATEKAPVDELILYGLFVIQLLGYTTSSLIYIVTYSAKTQAAAKEMHTTFVHWLVYSSMLLFSFSVVCTLLAVNTTNLFVKLVQLLLTVIILIVAFLNGEALEEHKKLYDINSEGEGPIESKQ